MARFHFGIRNATAGAFLALVGTVLLVVGTVTTPVNKSIYFLSTDVDVTILTFSISGLLKFGVWGYCLETDGIPAIIGGDEKECTPAKLGYSFSDTSVGEIVSDVVSIPNSLIKTLSYILVVHPISAALAFTVLVLAIGAHTKNCARSLPIVIWAFTAALFSFIVFIFDVVAFSIAKKKIEQNDATASLGNGIWIVLAGAIMMLLAAIALMIGRRMLLRRPTFEEKEAAKPQMDLEECSKLRENAGEECIPLKENVNRSSEDFNYSSEAMNAGVGYRQTPPLQMPAAIPLNDGSTISSNHTLPHMVPYTSMHQPQYAEMSQHAGDMQTSPIGAAYPYEPYQYSTDTYHAYSTSKPSRPLPQIPGEQYSYHASASPPPSSGAPSNTYGTPLSDFNYHPYDEALSTSRRSLPIPGESVSSSYHQSPSAQDHTWTPQPAAVAVPYSESPTSAQHHQNAWPVPQQATGYTDHTDTVPPSYHAYQPQA